MRWDNLRLRQRQKLMFFKLQFITKAVSRTNSLEAKKISLSDGQWQKKPSGYLFCYRPWSPLGRYFWESYYLSKQRFGYAKIGNKRHIIMLRVDDGKEWLLRSELLYKAISANL